MKHVTINLEDNKIEFYNTILGKETIKVNGKIVSEKSSMTGTEHNFTITENTNEMPYKFTTGFGINGAIFNLYKNGKPIIESPKSNLLIIIFGILIVLPILGVIIGFLFN
jgi:hypothetical protein